MSTANSQQVEALWQATECWEWSNSGGRTIVNIANKSEGDAGLQKLLNILEQCPMDMAEGIVIMIKVKSSSSVVMKMK